MRANSTADLRRIAQRVGTDTEAGQALLVAATRIEDLTTQRDWAQTRAKRAERRLRKAGLTKPQARAVVDAE